MSEKIAELTTLIVSAFLSENKIDAEEVPAFITKVRNSLSGEAVNHSEIKIGPISPPQEPAVPVDQSITDDYIICLEDGRRFKSMKRHLTNIGMTEQEYRKKWGLPENYPMAAPKFSEKRSMIAKEMGLGKSKARTPRLVNFSENAA